MKIVTQVTAQTRTESEEESGSDDEEWYILCFTKSESFCKIMCSVHCALSKSGILVYPISEYCY